ncbi:MAG TPA: RNA 2',3'-cyclic phosphodiesterase, partial [Methylomirabilota bacterium]|nr:RNA 2',3'-cyclic phosphodiesterase [Methylomirabilota bacterium]
MNALPERIRSFIAVPVPDSVRAQLKELQQRLKQELDDVSWTRPEAMHLTLQFLGNIESARLPELETSLREATRHFTSFELALGGIGSFGNRVIWIGIKHGVEPLRQLADAVRRAAHPFTDHD